MKISKQPGSDSGSSVFKIKEGGVADLNFVLNSSVNQRNGVAISTNNNLLNSAHIDLNSVFYKVSLNGPVHIKLNVESHWKITNKNLNNSYNASSNDGLITVQDDIVKFTALNVGELHFTIGNREFTVVCNSEAINRPYIFPVTNPYVFTNIQVHSSDFSAFNTEDTHDFSEWEMSYDPDFSTIIEESKMDSNNKTQWSLQNLQLDKNYYVRVRYKGQILTEISEWSPPLIIETPSRSVVSISKPQIISPSTNTNNIAVRPTIVSSSFSVNNWTDIHKFSHWQLASDIQFQNIVQEVQNSTTTFLEWKPNLLAVNNIFYARVRHEGENFGLSEWSEPIVFRTENLAVNRPSIVTPINGATGIKFTTELRSSAFNKIGSIVHESSTWQISNNSSFTTVIKQTVKDAINKTSWTVSGLAPNTTYYARVKHYSTDGIESEWSYLNTFVTEEISIYAPVVISPSNGNTDSNIELIIQSSAFGSNYNFTHKNSDWQLSANETFTALVASSSNDAINKTSWNPGRLNVNSTYYVRLRYRSTTDLTSPWSAPAVFTTKLMSVQKPSIVSPVNNSQDHLFVLNAVSSVFEQQGNLSHISSTWELSTNSSFNSIVTRLTKDTNNKTSWTVPGLLTNTDYYVRVKYHSEFDLESSWSNSVTFRTKAASVNTPTITSPQNDGLLYYGDNIISTSSFSSVGELSHSNTEWEIATDVNFTNIVASTDTTNTGNKLTWLVKTIV